MSHVFCNIRRCELCIEAMQAERSLPGIGLDTSLEDAQSLRDLRALSFVLPPRWNEEAAPTTPWGGHE